MIRSLISEIKEFKKPSILASLFMVFEVMFEISIPFVMASLLDQGVQQRNMNNILFYGGLMLVCAFLSLFCGMQSARYGAYASAGFAKNLRRAIFKKVQTFSFENIDQFSSGGLVTRMMTDVTNVQNAYQMVIRICVRAPLNLIFAIEDFSYQEALVTQAHEMKKELYVWTINDKQKLTKYLQQPIDGLITDELIEAQRLKKDLKQNKSYFDRFLNLVATSKEE